MGWVGLGREWLLEERRCWGRGRRHDSFVLMVKESNVLGVSGVLSLQKEIHMRCLLLS